MSTAHDGDVESVHLRGIPRRDQHEITRNQMTHPPRIIFRKRLIKPSESRTIHTRELYLHRSVLNRVQLRRSSRSALAFPSFSSSIHVSFFVYRGRRPPRRSAENPPADHSMIYNFDNQSHERRLIFIITYAPPLYLAWEPRCVWMQ